MSVVSDIMTALFTNRSNFLMHQVQKQNSVYQFPIDQAYPLDSFVKNARDTSMVISGGLDAERAEMICALINGARRYSAEPVFVVHCGNPYLKEDVLNHFAIPACTWRPLSLDGKTRKQQLALLTANDQEMALSIFWQFAFEVCDALDMPQNIDSIAEIDWNDLKWQTELLQKADRDTAVDLLSRFDKEMANLSVKATIVLEKILRGMQVSEMGKTGFFLQRGIYTIQVPGSSSMLTRQCLEFLIDATERGERFTLVLDNVFIANHPLIREAIPTVRLILSCNDLCSLTDNLNMLTLKRCGAVIFHHSIPEHSEMLSRYLFGNYEKVLVNQSFGTHRGNYSVFLREQSDSVSINRTKDLRLNPGYINNLPIGTACVRLPDYGEGVLSLLETDYKGGLICLKEK